MLKGLSIFVKKWGEPKSLREQINLDDMDKTTQDFISSRREEHVVGQTKNLKSQDACTNYKVS